MLFLFSADSDFIFGKNAPCQLLRPNFKNKSEFFNYDFSFKLSAITRFCSTSSGNALIFVHGQFIDFFSKLKKKLLKHGISYLRMFNSIAAVQKMSATVSDSGFVRFANI